MGFGIENIRDDLRSAAPGDTLRAAIEEITVGGRGLRADLHVKQASQKSELDGDNFRWSRVSHKHETLLLESLTT